VLGASVAEFDVGSHGGEQVACGLDVADLRDVFEDDGLIGEQGGGHAGQGGIFGSADADGAEQRLSAADDEFVHKSEFIVAGMCGEIGVTKKREPRRAWGSRRKSKSPLLAKPARNGAPNHRAKDPFTGYGQMAYYI
jgi:hypothetical protein